jgi:cytidylate kinase
LIQFNGQDLTDIIRQHEVSAMASQVSRYKVIRDFLAKWQRDIPHSRPAVLDGRDIGTVIFPEARLKIYLTATPEQRAYRRYQELKARGQVQELEVILKDINLRDHQDMTRKIAPLKKANDAIEVDSSALTVNEIVRIITTEWKKSTKGSL